MRSVGDVGMLFGPVDDLESVGQAADDVAVNRGVAELVELGFVVHRPAVHGEALAECVGPEVVEARRLACFGDQLVDDQVAHAVKVLRRPAYVKDLKARRAGPTSPPRPSPPGFRRSPPARNCGRPRRPRRPSTRARSRDGAQDETRSEREAFGPYLVTHVGHACGQQVVHRVAAGAGERVGDLGFELRRILLDELRKDDEETAAAPAAFRQLRRGAHDRLDDGSHVGRRGAPTRSRAARLRGGPGSRHAVRALRRARRRASRSGSAVRPGSVGRPGA